AGKNRARRMAPADAPRYPFPWVQGQGERWRRVAKVPPGVGPRYPQVVVLVGATGDLARRKLLPGLFHLSGVGFIPGCRIIGVSLDDLDPEGFRKLARGALDEFYTREVSEEDWASFAECLDYGPLGGGAAALRAAVERAEKA